nr:transposase [Tenacibaculum finnmarkense]
MGVPQGSGYPFQSFCSFLPKRISTTIPHAKKEKQKNVARTKLALWYNKVEDENLKSFNTIKKTIQHHYKPILNYFNNSNTNASAESFNAKIYA